MRVPPAAVEAFANQAINLIPEAQTTIEKGDQRRKVSGGGGGGMKCETSPINFTASQALHDLHLLMLTMLAEVDWAHNLPHRYRTPIDAAREIRLYPTLLAETEQIEEQLKAGRRHLDKLAQEIDLPPDPIPLGECECGEPMVAVEGQEVIECRRCETPWEVDERQANRRNRIIATIKRPVTPPQAAAILEQCGVSISRKTINKWVERGKLKVEDGRVSVSDIIDVAANSRPGRPSAVDI